MKTLRFFGMVLLTVLMSAGFTACGDDDDDIGNVSNIYGTWETTHSEGWEKTNGKLDDEWDWDASESSNTDYLGRFVFTEDGEAIHYEWTGSRWYLCCTHDYTISGNKLRIKDFDGDDEDLVMTIKTLTESVLVLESSDSWTEDGEKYESYEKQTFKKVD